MAKKSNNLIKINGRLYDVSTGQLATPLETENKLQAKSIDGVVPATRPKTATVAKQKPKSPRHSTKRQTSIKPSKTVHSRPKRSTTLNRKVVSKPKLAKKVPLKAITQPATGTLHTESANLVAEKQKLAQNIDKERIDRAQAVHKSPAVAKFPFATKASANKVHIAIEPKPEPKIVDKPQPPNLKDQLIAEQMAKLDTRPKSQSAKTHRSWFAKKPKTASLVALAASSLLLIGYITYLNIPNMALRIAAREAGFNAQMPGYRPNGFSFAGPIAYNKGELTVKFVSNTDDQSYYTISERKTSWDSLTLRDNYVSGQIDKCSTYQERGLTIYICNGNTATWVNGGLWYTIDGDANLNADQILKIAASL